MAIDFQEEKTIDFQPIDFQEDAAPEQMVGVFGKVPQSAYNRGERNIVGNAFERPGAAIRSFLQGNGYEAGAINPTNVPTFQDLAIKKAQFTTNPALNAMLGMPASAAGMALDVATNPADVLPMVAGQLPGVKQGMAALSQTKAATEFSKFLNKQRSVSSITSKFPKIMTDEWLTGKAKEVKSAVDNTMTAIKDQYKQIFKPHLASPVSVNDLSAIPKSVQSEYGINQGTTLGRLWEIRDELLSDIAESAWDRPNYYKKIRPNQKFLQDAVQKIKSVVLNKLPKDAREEILNLDPKYTKAINTGKKLVKTVYESNTDTYKTGPLINTFKNPDNAGAREAFEEFSKFNDKIAQVEKDIGKYVFRQKAKNFAKRAAGVAALGAVGYKLIPRGGQ